MMPPAMSGPRELLSPQLLQLIASYNEPQNQTWEQVLARRYLDAITGKNQNLTGMSSTPYYPQQMDMLNQLTPDVIEMVKRSGMSVEELISLMMGGQ